MLFKQTLLIFTVFAVANAAQIEPRDLIDEVIKQLEELKEIVTGEILSGHNALGSLLAEFGRNSAMTTNSAVVGLKNSHETVLGQLFNYKELAEQAGIDPSSCISGPEELFPTLVPKYTQIIGDCVKDVDAEANKMGESSKYIIDVAFSTVSHLEYQIARCNEDLLCIAPILTEIELNKIKLPQNIKTEVQVFQEIALKLKVSTQDCPDRYLVAYSSEAWGLLSDIRVCLNNM